MRYLFLLGLILSGLLATAPAASAQTGIEILDNSIALDYPDLLTFNLEVRSDTPIQSVTLFYGTNAVACQSNQVRKPMDGAVGRDLKMSWEIELDRFTNLPAGAQISWQWEITNESGTVLTTELMTQVVNDARYAWKSLKQGALTVQWVEGGSDFGQQLMNTAEQSLDRLAREAGLDAPESVILVIYPSAEDVRNAVHYVPDWTGGLAFPEYNVILMGIAPGQGEWLAEVVPHELAHLVTNHRIFNCQGGDMPTWLSEGLSVYAEGPTKTTDSNVVLAALEADTLDPLESLANGFASNSQRAGQAYAQSGIVVHYMIREYGVEKLDLLFDAIQAGQKIDDALMTAYGFDTYGLDTAWRTSLGFSLPERAAPTATPQGLAATPIPTLALWTQAYSASTPTISSPTETPVPAATLATETPIPAVTLPDDTPVVSPIPLPQSVFPIIPVLLFSLVLMGGGAFLVFHLRSKRN